MEDGQNSSATEPSIESIAAELKDDTFYKLVDDFLGSQTGEGLDLDENPCRNRLLVQVGLMKEDSDIPWTSVMKWLQKIFPMFQSADFRCLIERNITTALSLTGEAREAFLESNVNFEFVGPVCDSIGIGRTDLLEMSDFSDRAGLTDVTNGLVLELSNFVTREKIDPVVLVSWLRNFEPQFCSDGKIQKANKVLQSKLNKFRIQYRNYQRSRFRNSGMMDEFLQSPFDLTPTLTETELRRVISKSQVKRKGPGSNPGHRRRAEIKMESVPLDISEQTEYGSLTQHGDYANEYVDATEPGQTRVKTEPTDVLYPSQLNLFTVKEELEPVDIENHQTRSETPELAESPKSDTGDCLTLLDVSVLSVQKLSSMYGGKSEVAKLVSLDLLRNQYSLMLQEDAPMKALHEKITSLPDGHSLAPPLTFLHYNTHFLLDLNDAIEEQMMSFEREIVSTTGENLGRDNNPKFHSFMNFEESGCKRFFNMASEILCPRGETNNNYRRHWLAFCIERNNPSRLPVNQSNRYLNNFEAAAGLIHHYSDVSLFFSDLLLLNDEPNIILDSVNDDACDEALQALICVIAIVYCKIIGPYWQLLKSAAQYCVFSRYVLYLHQKVMQWSKDAAPLLLPELQDNVFLQVPLQEKTFKGVFSFCSLNSENQYGILIKACLERLMKVIAAVIEENLKDFLPGGKYSEEPSVELTNELASCTFSDLMGEYPFGHGYAPKRNRQEVASSPTQSSSSDVSAHSPSAQRKSLPSPSPPRQVKVQSVSKSPRNVLNRGSHPRCKVKKRGRKPKWMTKYQEDLQDSANKNAIISTVTKNGGPCKTRQDVDRLLEKLDGASHAQKREAIRCEIGYQKLVLGSKNTHLNHLGFSLTDMVTKLKIALPNEEGPLSSNTTSRSSTKNHVSTSRGLTNLELTNKIAVLETTPEISESIASASNEPDVNVTDNSDIDLGKSARSMPIYTNYRENFDDFPSIS